MIKGTVESISKTSIVVSIGTEAKTLTGAAVEALAPTVTLGAVVEFDSATSLKTIRVVPKEKAQTAPRRSSSSPKPAFAGEKVQF